MSKWVLESVLCNWNEWRKEFEHGNSFVTNPILTNSTRFREFCYEYRVHRTIRAGLQEEFQSELRKSLLAPIADDTGGELDRLEKKLRSKFGTREGKNPLISVTSKVASFLRPDRFIAWDKYAKAGLNILSGRSKAAKWSDYQTYLMAVHKVLDSGSIEELEVFIRLNDKKVPINSEAFRLRTFDTYLMWKGNRWPKRFYFG